MTFDSGSFLQLCKELRQLGCVKVEAFGFTAIFTPQASAPLTRVRGSKAEQTPAPSDAELAEAVRRRELGLDE